MSVPAPGAQGNPGDADPPGGIAGEPVDASAALWQSGSVGGLQPPSIPGIRVERLVGEGGFGAVWLAEQVAPVRRRIALKVLRARMPGPRLRARFEAERQLLARMEHPGVARIFDAGETDDGRLWFAMEFVEGQRIDAWCDSRRAPLHTRVSLLMQACAAVQHAHSKGVVHCDLKPTNVLVCEVDGAPLVKVIDFGVARVVDGSDAVPTMGSEAAGPLGTLEFMAPEQVRGIRDADTRTDVWAIGVMLYELLCGTLPFDSRTLRSGGLPAAAQMIAEAEPEPPSSAILSLAADDLQLAESRALSRASSPRRLAGMLRQELDWVALRCLEKDPDARYSGAAALAEDLARWMRDEPVMARAPGVALRARKFVRRHRLGVAVAATALVTLLAGLAGTGYGLLTARRNLTLAEDNLDLANRQLARFERLREFNASILGAVDPATARGMDTRLLRMMIDGAAGSIDSRFADDAMVAADVHRTVGVAYRSIGEWESAESHLRAVLALAEREHGPGSPETARARNDLGEVLVARGRLDDAAPLVESAHELRLSALGADHPDRLVSLHNLALLRDAQARLPESESLYAEALERRRAVLGPDADATTRTLVNLAEVQRQLGKLQAARASLDAAVASRAARLGPEHPDTLSARQSRALIMRVSDNAVEARAELEAILPVMQRVLGPDHNDTVSARHSAASIRRDAGDVSGAEAEFRDLARILEMRLGPDHVRTLIVRNDLAAALELQGKLDEAESIGRDVLERYRRTLGDAAPRTMTATNNLGYVYWAMGRHADAERHWTIAADGFAKALGPDHANTIGARAATARAMLARGAASEARALVEGPATNPPKGLSAARRLQCVLAYARILAALAEWEPAFVQFDAAWTLAGASVAQRQEVAARALETIEMARKASVPSAEAQHGTWSARMTQPAKAATEPEATASQPKPN